MDHEERKAAIAAYKERKPVAGLYALRCCPTGELWVGRTADLDAMRRRMAFTLAHGVFTRPSLRSAWRTHGADAFAYEEVERFDPDEDPDVRDRLLKKRLEHFREVLGAEPV